MMKHTILLLFAFLPLFALGQHNATHTAEVGYLHAENTFVQNSVDTSQGALEKAMRTTLINDYKYEKSILNFDSNKSYDLSFRRQSNKKLKLSNEQESNGVLFKVNSSKDFKKKFKDAGNSIDF